MHHVLLLYRDMLLLSLLPNAIYTHTYTIHPHIPHTHIPYTHTYHKPTHIYQTQTCTIRPHTYTSNMHRDTPHINYIHQHTYNIHVHPYTSTNIHHIPTYVYHTYRCKHRSRLFILGLLAWYDTTRHLYTDGRELF